MPINLCTLTPYSVNYDSLENFLLNETPTFFNDASIQKKYFLQWISLLKICDTQNTKYFNSSKNKLSTIANIEKEPESYQQEISIGNNTFYLHYRVSYIKFLLMQANNSIATQVNIDEFTANPPIIHWEYPADFDSNFPLNPQPVVAVEYPNPSSNYLIVDGNHRIAKHISCNNRSLPVFFFNIEQVVQYKLLAISFDLVLYLLQNDVYNLSYLKNAKHLSDAELLSQSFYGLAHQHSLGIC